MKSRKLMVYFSLYRVMLDVEKAAITPERCFRKQKFDGQYQKNKANNNGI